MYSDIDILSFYLSGLMPTKVQSFGSIGHFKKSRKPAEASTATNCLDCAYESKCPWSAKKIYIDSLGTETLVPVCIPNRSHLSSRPYTLHFYTSIMTDSSAQWAKLFVDADVLDIENVTEALRTTPYGRCVYECDNDVVDHQVVNIEYEGGATASMTMSACKLYRPVSDGPWSLLFSYSHRSPVR